MFHPPACQAVAFTYQTLYTRHFLLTTVFSPRRAFSWITGEKVALSAHSRPGRGGFPPGRGVAGGPSGAGPVWPGRGGGRPGSRGGQIPRRAGQVPDPVLHIPVPPLVWRAMGPSPGRGPGSAPRRGGSLPSGGQIGAEEMRDPGFSLGRRGEGGFFSRYSRFCP